MCCAEGGITYHTLPASSHEREKIGGGGRGQMGCGPGNDLIKRPFSSELPMAELF